MLVLDINIILIIILDFKFVKFYKNINDQFSNEFKSYSLYLVKTLIKKPNF